MVDLIWLGRASYFGSIQTSFNNWLRLTCGRIGQIAMRRQVNSTISQQLLSLPQFETHRSDTPSTLFHLFALSQPLSSYTPLASKILWFIFSFPFHKQNYSMGQRFCGQIDFPGGKGWWRGGWTRGRDPLVFTEWTKLKNCSLMCDLSVIKSIFQCYFLSLFFLIWNMLKFIFQEGKE